ncbi:MAG: OmpH family outer membrane protein [Bacteroidales bacterium]|nr:OmpH family outer membrane protein [Bacteroidales bacterium]MDE6084129.1 OmpH family outer membrane protein [Muribaculaceae bacterium]
MIKKLLFAIMLAFPMLLSAQTLKVGLVDLNTVMAAMPEMTQAQTKLQDVQKKYQDEAQKLEDEMKRLYDEFQNMPDTELPAIKERKARELQDYQQKMQNFEQSAMQDLQKMQNELMAPIVAKINQAVESVGKEGAYSLIQVKEPQLTLYYANPVVDITNDVKAKLGIK